MNVENAVYPTQAQIAGLMGEKSDKPIVMLNLLKFRDKAYYADGRASELSGRDAYMLYGAAMQKVVAREGGRILFTGAVASLAIGAVDELWDATALVEYPSAAAFARIATSAEVTEIGVHRAAGLAGQLLIRVSQD